MSTMVANPPKIAGQPALSPANEVTPEDLLGMSDRRHYELVDGKLRERNVSLLSSRVAVTLGRKLDTYREQYSLGWVVESECGYRCFPWKPRLVRRADLSFIARERLPSKEHWSDEYVTIPPDLAVEVVSPTDLVSDLDEKVEEYLRAGVRLVWVAHPAISKLEIRRGDGSGIWLRAEDELTGEDVIPGFRCRVGDLFPVPPQDEDGSSANPEPSGEAPNS